MNEKVSVSVSPHITSEESLSKIMWSVILALFPVGIAGVFIFGVNSFYLILVSVFSALVSEAVVEKIRKRPLTVFDGSALITGLLLAYNLPPEAPLWIAVVGPSFGVIVGKHLFGGLGFNIFNPALVGRAFLMASWPAHMTSWVNPRWIPDAISTATPLGVLKEASRGDVASLMPTSTPGYFDLFIGNRGGCIGEVCIIALLIGAIFLLMRKCITWHIPLTFIGTVGLLSWAFMGKGLFKGDWLFFILSGGLVLGAFFMATDMVTSPITKKGKIIFGIMCGVITFVIRKWGGYPEGVSYSILIMNAATPLIDRHTRLRKFGFVKKK